MLSCLPGFGVGIDFLVRNRSILTDGGQLRRRGRTGDDYLRDCSGNLQAFIVRYTERFCRNWWGGMHASPLYPWIGNGGPATGESSRTGLGYRENLPRTLWNPGETSPAFNLHPLDPDRGFGGWTSMIGMDFHDLRFAFVNETFLDGILTGN